MSTYTITNLHAVRQVPCPSKLPCSGDRLRVLKPFHTVAGFQYNPGDGLLLVRRTNHAPHGLRSSLGNWLVQDKHHTSVWTNIEWMLTEEIVEVSK